MKKTKFLVVLLLVICFVTACNKSDETFTVTFDTDGGSNVTTVEVYEKQLVSIPATPTKDGYTFLGWYLNDTAFDFSTKITKDITLVAKWSINSNTEKTWNVTFDSNGGSSVANKTVKDGETLSSNIKTTRDGYTFLGWYLGETKFDFSTKITKDIKLTAKWEKKVVEPKYGYIWEEVSGSVAGEYYLYITKDGKKISGTASLTSKSGKVATADIPVTGLKIVKDTIAGVSNIKEN